ncbi:MAG: hypothetical protein C4326_00960 [Ignavibacteria bacterium]
MIGGTRSEVMAEINFWTDDPPHPAKFCVEGNSTIVWDNWLGSCTSGGSAPVKIGGEGSETMSLVGDSLLNRTLAMRGVRNYAAALAIYTDLLAGQPHAPEAEIALLELRNAYHDYADFSGNENLRQVMRTFLRTQMNDHPNAAVKLLAKLLTASELMRQEDFASAQSEYLQLLATASTSEQRRACVSELFNISAMGLHNRAAAAGYLARLQREWPNHDATKIAALRFASFPERTGSNKPLGGSAPLGKDGAVNSALPTAYRLEQNDPNPFNPSTTIRYALTTPARVHLAIYNVLGQRVAELVNDVQAAGVHSLVWDGRNSAGVSVASGVYFYRIEAQPMNANAPFTAIKKMMLLK